MSAAAVAQDGVVVHVLEELLLDALDRESTAAAVESAQAVRSAKRATVVSDKLALVSDDTISALISRYAARSASVAAALSGNLLEVNRLLRAFEATFLQNAGTLVVSYAAMRDLDVFRIGGGQRLNVDVEGVAMSLDGVLAVVARALKHLSVGNATRAVPDLLRYAMGERSAGLFSVFLLLESTERTNPDLKSLWSKILKNCMEKAVDLRAGKKVADYADADDDDDGDGASGDAGSDDAKDDDPDHKASTEMVEGSSCPSTRCLTRGARRGSRARP